MKLSAHWVTTPQARQVDYAEQSVPSGPVIPSTGIYGYLLHDFQSSAYFRPSWGYSVPRSLLSDTDKLKNENGYPQMVPGDPREGVKLTEPFQWFWVVQLVLSKYGIQIEPSRASFEVKLSRAQQDYIQRAWRILTRDDTAFTNQAGTNHKGDPTGVDYINRTDGGAGTPRLWENGCGGTVVELFSAAPEKRGYKAKTLKTSEFATWKTWTYRSHPARFVYATNSTPYLVGTVNTVSKTGPWKVDPMHMLDGADVIVPLISDGGYVYFEADRVKVLRAGEAWPRPYVP